MNARTTAVVAGLFALVIAVSPASASAAPLGNQIVELPENVQGVTETQFAEIKQATPCGAQPLQACASALPTGVFARIEDRGQMYQLHGTMNEDIYTLRMHRYLSDGLYRYGKNVFLVQKGKRIKLTKGTAYKRMVEAAPKGAATTVGSDVIEMVAGRSCGALGGDLLLKEMLRLVSECDLNEQLVRVQYAGKLLLDSTTGELWYMAYNAESAVKVRPRLGKNYDKINWYSYVYQVAGVQDKGVITDLPSGKKFGF